MKTELIKCDGCDRTGPAEGFLIEIKPLRGGLDLNLTRPFPPPPSAGSDGSKWPAAITGHGTVRINRIYHFCNPSCVAKMIADRIDEIAVPAAKQKPAAEAAK